MRKIILFVFFAAFCACQQNDSEVFRILVSADSLLANEQYDSTLSLIQRNPPVNISQRVTAYHSLLKTQALYKLYKPISSDSIINCAIDYYCQCGDNKNLARAYYYKGGILDNLNRPKEALECLKEAEKLLNGSNEFELRHHVCYMIAYINSLYDEYSLAIQYMEKALKYSTCISRPDLLAYDYEKISLFYYNLGERDSNLFYINKCIEMIDFVPEMPASNRARIWTDLGYSYYNRSNEKSILFLEKAIAMAPQGNAFRLLAQIHKDNGNIVKAKEMLTKDIETGESVYSKIESLLFLSKIEQESGNYKQATEFSQQAYMLRDSLNKRQREDNIMAQQIAFDRKTEAERAYLVKRWLWTGIGVVALIGGVAVSILMRRSRRAKQQLAKEQLRVEQLSEEEHKVNKELSKAIGKVEQMKRIRHEQDKAISNQLREWQQHGKTLERGHQLFMKLTNGGNIRQWTSNDFKDFRTYYDCVDSAFAESITKNYNQLSPNLYLLSVLEHLGKNDDEIMITMGLTIGALRTTHSRLNQKQKGA